MMNLSTVSSTGINAFGDDEVQNSAVMPSPVVVCELGMKHNREEILR